MNTNRKRSMNPLSLLLIPMLLLSSAATAQSAFYFVPSLSAGVGTDDNLFFSSVGKVSDSFTRLTPSIEAGYESGQASWRAYYTFDAESYKDNEQLDSNQMRQMAELSFEIQSSPLLTLAATVQYTKTETPSDLNLLNGLLPGRFQAERFSVNPSLSYRLSEVSTATMGYTLQSDTVSGGFSNDSHRFETRYDHELSTRNTFNVGYILRRYEFSDDSSTDSHTPWIGWIHQYSPQTQFLAEIGPRIQEDSTEPYISAAVRRQYVNGSMELRFISDETVSIGDTGRVDNETVSAGIYHMVGNNLNLGLTSSIGRVSYYDLTSDVFSVGVDVNYRFMDSIYFSLAYQHNFQETGFPILGEREIARNVVVAAITFTLPRRTTTTIQRQ